MFISTQQKGEGYFNLAKVISVAAEWHVTPTLSFYFSYTLETDSMCAMCRVSPRPQTVSRVCYEKKLNM